MRLGIAAVLYSGAAEEVLCFGRIDSKLKPVAGEKFIHYFSKRKANSVRSKFNQEIIMRLTSRGLLPKAGEDSVEAAKQN